MDSPARLQSRDALSLETLEMRCDADGTPEGGDGNSALGHWIAKEASYVGLAATEENRSPRLTALRGFALLTVERDRLLGILHPATERETCVWWAWSRAAIRATSTASAIYRRLPRLSIASSGNAVDLIDVCRLDRQGRKYFDGEAHSLIRALQA